MEKGLMINLGSIKDIAIGHGRCFVVKGEEVAVFRLRNGKYHAIGNKCPHLQGPLSDGTGPFGRQLSNRYNGVEFFPRTIKSTSGIPMGLAINAFSISARTPI